MSKIRIRIAVCPIDENDPTETFYCDIEVTEANIQSVDNQPHGFEDFIDRFIEPPMALILDEFQQYFSDPEDLMRKMKGRDHLPRSIDFYREKIAMRKARRAAA